MPLDVAYVVWNWNVTGLASYTVCSEKDDFEEGEQEILVLGTVHAHLNQGDSTGLRIVVHVSTHFHNLLSYTYPHPLFSDPCIPNHQIHIVCIHAL